MICHHFAKMHNKRKRILWEKIRTKICVLGNPPWSQGKCSVSGYLVEEAMFVGSGQAQPEKEIWIHPLVGTKPTGGATEVRAMGIRGLGGLIPGC